VEEIKKQSRTGGLCEGANTRPNAPLGIEMLSQDHEMDKRGRAALDGDAAVGFCDAKLWQLRATNGLPSDRIRTI